MMFDPMFFLFLPAFAWRSRCRPASRHPLGVQRVLEGARRERRDRAQAAQGCSTPPASASKVVPPPRHAVGPPGPGDQEAHFLRTGLRPAIGRRDRRCLPRGASRHPARPALRSAVVALRPGADGHIGSSLGYIFMASSPLHGLAEVFLLGAVIFSLVLLSRSSLCRSNSTPRPAPSSRFEHGIILPQRANRVWTRS